MMISARFGSTYNNNDGHLVHSCSVKVPPNFCTQDFMFTSNVIIIIQAMAINRRGVDELFFKCISGKATLPQAFYY